VNHVIGSSFRLDSNRHEACGLLQSIPGILRDASGFSRFLGFFFLEILHNSLEFLRIFEDSSGFFRILHNSLGFLRIFEDSSGFFRILQDSLGFSRFLGEFFLDSSQFFGILKDA